MRVGGRLVGGSGGLGGDQVPQVRFDFLEGLVVVVGVVHRHMLDTGGDAPYCLDAPRPPPCALPLPPCPRAPPCLFSGAYVTLPPLAPFFNKQTMNELFQINVCSCKMLPKTT